MKRFLAILLVFTMILPLAACGKGGSIIGKWAFGVNTFEFREDNTVSISVNETLNYDGKYTVDGNKIIITAEGLMGEVSEEFTYSLKKNKLTLTGDITLMGTAPVTIDFAKQSDLTSDSDKSEKSDKEESEKKEKSGDTEKKGIISKILSIVFPNRAKEDESKEDTNKKGFLSKLFSSIFHGKNKDEKKDESSVKNEDSSKKEDSHTHKYSLATCTEPEKCSCGDTRGETLGHLYLEGQCSVCGAKDPNTLGSVREAVIGREWVRIRSGPGTDTDVVYHNGEEIQLNPGHSVTIYGDKVVGTDTNYPEWYQISFIYKGAAYEGYVFWEYVTLSGDDGKLSSTEKHEHIFSSRTTKQATCAAEGEKTYTCSCGHSYTESISKKTSHNWASATCTTPKTCKTCGKTEGTANGHSYYSSGKCSGCGSTNPVVDQALAKCSLTLPVLPKSISYFGYNGSIYTTVSVTNITYKFECNNSGEVELDLYFSGEKIHDYRGVTYNDYCKIGWKLYGPDGSVVKSDTFYSPSVAVGDTFLNQKESAFDTYDNLPVGNYRLEICDINY